MNLVCIRDVMHDHFARIELFFMVITMSSRLICYNVLLM